MKRSEMVEAMARYVNNKIQFRDNWSLALKQAEELLSLVENEGMSPPIYVKRLNVDEMDELGANNIGFYTGYEHIYEWEPEDE